MDGDLVAVIVRVLERLRAVVGGAVNAVSDNEEGGSVAVFCKLVDYRLGAHVVRSVVKGQSDTLCTGIAVVGVSLVI